MSKTIEDFRIKADQLYEQAVTSGAIGMFSQGKPVRETAGSLIAQALLDAYNQGRLDTLDRAEPKKRKR